MAPILVTGGSGLVGSHLKNFLPDATYISSADFDLTSETEVKELFLESWDRVIHLAARVGGILDNIKRPAEYIEDNLLMNTLVLKYARETGVRRVTASLTTCILPDTNERYPMTQDDLFNGPPQKTNFSYAISKRAMAVQIDAYNRQFGTEYNYLIPSNLYGEGDHSDGQQRHFVTALIAKIVKAQREGSDRISLLGTGKPLRQFLHADDLARVIAEVVEHDITHSFSVAPDENLSIREIAELAVEECAEGALKIEFDESSPDGQFRKDVSNARMKSILKDFEFTPLRAGLRRVYEAYSVSM